NGGFGISVLTVTVNNVPPTAHAGPSQAINEGDTASFHGTATDPGAPPETLSYAWDFNYDGQTFVAQASGADTTHAFVQVGTYQVALRVTDSNGARGLSVTTVTANNVAPTPSAGADQTINEGDTAVFHATLTDPGQSQEAYLYEWDFNYNGQSLVVQALGADASHQFVQPGTYQVALRVTDSNGGSGVSVLTVTVNNVPPTADAGPSQAINEGDTATFHGTATDPGAPPETLSY